MCGIRSKLLAVLLAVVIGSLLVPATGALAHGGHGGGHGSSGGGHVGGFGHWGGGHSGFYGHGGYRHYGGYVRPYYGYGYRYPYYPYTCYDPYYGYYRSPYPCY